MKSTKKIIIGVIAVIALLITIAGALAMPTVNYDPTGNSATVNKTQPVPFTATVQNQTPDTTLGYQWKVGNTVVGNANLFTFDGNNYSVGQYQVSVIVTENNTLIGDNVWTVTVQDPQPTSVLSVTSVKVNGKSNGRLTLSDLNEVEVEIANDHTLDIEDVEVTVKILDVDGNDLKEEAEIDEIRNGDEEKVSVEFDLSNEEVDEEEYDIEVEVEGEDEDGDLHTYIKKFTVEVDREKDDLTITKAELEDSQVFCSANPQTSLKVKVKNIGENDQDGAKITVKNSELDVDLQMANIDLDDYAGSDNDYEKTFPLNLEDAKQGTYTLKVTVYSEDDELMDSEEVELQVTCPEGTSSQEEQKEEQYADKELAAELQKKIDEYRAVQESQAAAKGNFRETSSYVLLLGVLVAMMFFAAVLSATYLLVKKK